MDQEKEKEIEVKKGSPLMWILIVIIIIVAGLAIWYFTSAKDEAETTAPATETKTASVAPKHADWQVFNSSKYGFKLYYPTDYTIAESAVGTIKLSKAGAEIMDMYVYAANGDEAGMVRSTKALYTDATKGYMTGAVEAATIAGGQSATKMTGTFGKNAGVSQTHAGVKGSTVFFGKSDKLFVFSSYDNADATAITNFEDMMTDLSF